MCNIVRNLNSRHQYKSHTMAERAPMREIEVICPNCMAGGEEPIPAGMRVCERRKCTVCKGKKWFKAIPCEDWMRAIEALPDACKQRNCANCAQCRIFFAIR